jgi:hypothetical protein
MGDVAWSYRFVVRKDVNGHADEHQGDHEPNAPISMSVHQKVMTRVNVIPQVGALIFRIMLLGHFTPDASMKQKKPTQPNTRCVPLRRLTL